MSEFVIIGSRLPHGLSLHVQGDDRQVVVNGLNSAKIIGATYVTTEVDKDFWDVWVEEHKDFEALKNKALFVAKSDASAAKIAEEVKQEKTGFEPLSPEAMGVEKAKED